MIRVSAWLTRIALLHLLLGFLAGGLLLLHKGDWLPAIPGLLIMHIEWVLMGWMGLMALAVAWWIFPRIDRHRPSAWPVWIAGGVFIAGVWTVIIGAGAGLPSALLAGRLLELGGLLGMGATLWPRIRAYRRRQR